MLTLNELIQKEYPILNSDELEYAVVLMSGGTVLSNDQAFWRKLQQVDKKIKDFEYNGN